MEEIKHHLHTALATIREAPERIAALRLRSAAAEEVAAAEDLLRDAEEVRRSASLLILQEIAEAKAAELLVLDTRRRELVASLQTYGDVALFIAGQSHRTFESRRVSAALLLGLEPPDVDAYDDARRGWQIEADRLLATEPGGTNG